VARSGASPGEAIDYERLAAALRGSVPVVLEIDGREFARTTAGDMSREFYTRANSYR
jgi:hypothetical protein